MLCVPTLQPNDIVSPITPFNFKVLRAVWNGPESSSDVEKILNNIPALDLWSPESLEYVYDTQSADFMIPNHLVDNVMNLLRKDHLL